MPSVRYKYRHMLCLPAGLVTWILRITRLRNSSVMLPSRWYCAVTAFCSTDAVQHYFCFVCTMVRWTFCRGAWCHVTQTEARRRASYRQNLLAEYSCAPHEFWNTHWLIWFGCNHIHCSSYYMYNEPYGYTHCVVEYTSCCFHNNWYQAPLVRKKFINSC